MLVIFFLNLRFVWCLTLLTMTLEIRNIGLGHKPMRCTTESGSHPSSCPIVYVEIALSPS